MDLSRLTQKSQEALAAAQNRAVTLGHQQVDCEHVLAALVEAEDGLIARLCQKLDAPRDGVLQALEQELSRLPSMAGPGFEAAKATVLAAVGEDIGEANETREKVDIVAALVDKENTIHAICFHISMETRSSIQTLQKEIAT